MHLSVYGPVQYHTGGSMGKKGTMHCLTHSEHRHPQKASFAQWSIETSLRIWRGYNFPSVRPGYAQQGSLPPGAFWAQQCQHQKHKASVQPRLKNWNLHHLEPHRLTESPRNMDIATATAGEPDPHVCLHCPLLRKIKTTFWELERRLGALTALLFQRS